MPIKNHVERIKVELDELDIKLDKLGVFIYESEKFEKLCQFERARMIKQLGFMQAYRDVLFDRLEDAK